MSNRPPYKQNPTAFQLIFALHRLPPSIRLSTLAGLQYFEVRA